jgi:GT2 family glycosyltransferase
MDISFVILNFNRKKELLETIQKTKELSNSIGGSFEIIVVDNASSDSSNAVVKDQHPDVIIIERLINNGVAGWNDGFAAARGDYFVVLDDDSNILSGLDEAITYLKHHPKVGVLALNITGGAFETVEDLGWIDRQNCLGFVGCGAILRKELYLKIGGFAEWLFIYSHEDEYGLRCLDAGYELRFFKGCIVLHRTSSINRTTRRLKVFSIRNEMGIVYKFFSKDRRNLYLLRVYLHNLKSIYRLGFSSIPWYFSALMEFHKLKKTLKHTPVRKEVEEIYSKTNWHTKPFLGII